MSTEKRLVFAKRMFRPRSNTGHAVVGGFHIGDGSDRSLNQGPRGATQGSHKLKPYGRAVGGRDFRTLKIASFASMTNGEILPPEALLEELPKPAVRARVVVRVIKKDDPDDQVVLRQAGKDKLEAVTSSGEKIDKKKLPKELVVDLEKSYSIESQSSPALNARDLADELARLGVMPGALRNKRGEPTWLLRALQTFGVSSKEEALAKSQTLRKRW